MESPVIDSSVNLSKANLELYEEVQKINFENINAFTNWFENLNSTNSDGCKTPKTNTVLNNDYSPGYINKMFKNCLPENYETPEQNDLFPPSKKVRFSDNEKDSDSESISLNMIDVKLRENEATHLSENQRKILNKLLNDENIIFSEISKPIPHVEHIIKTSSNEPIACTS